MFWRWGPPAALALISAAAWLKEPPTRLDMCVVAGFGALGWLFLALTDESNT